MAITSESNKHQEKRYGNTQIRYCLTYVVITFAVLLFLNIYCSKTMQQVFYKGKETAMLEKCRTASLALSELDVMNPENVKAVLEKNDSLMTSRVVITDAACSIIFDTASAEQNASKTSGFPEIKQANLGYDVFSWNYRDGTMVSCAAAPICSYSAVTGCVYMMENDASQGALMKSLQRNIFSITLFLEIIVILFSALTALVFSGKLRRILSSMRIIHGGDYSHKVRLRGHDELNLLADEFNNLTERLQTSENKRRQFVSDASHELKTPLASIKLLSDSILQNEMDMDTVKEFVGDIGNEAERLNRMSEKLLSLTRIESQEDGDCEIIFMAPTIQRVIKMLSGIASANKISIITDYSQDAPILILEDDLHEIVFNLVENGIKYNRPNGQLYIRTYRDSDNAVLSVRDTGVGIPQEALTHVFERFFRVDKARSRKSGGSGLGLSIVKNLVERNGGNIHADSTPEVGSVFTVTFPIFDPDENTL